MPNWVLNRITFRNKGDMQRTHGIVWSDDSEFDFNMLIPMSPELILDDGSFTKPAIAWYLSNRGSVTAVADQEKVLSDIEAVSKYVGGMDELYELGKKYVDNIEKYGHATWYGWSIEKWGTKWNASEVSWDEDENCVTFTTAWSAPFPVVEELARRANISFGFEWADEDIGSNCGSGRVTPEKVSVFPIIDCESAIEFANDLWGFDGDEGYWEDENE